MPVNKGLLCLCWAMLGGMTAAQDKPLHGVNLSDMDRKVPPCNDFFEYANGSWRANNPIPPSMVRWSRRWQSGETNNEAAINKQGAKPVASDLALIESMETAADLQNVIMHLNQEAILVPVPFGATQDPHNPTQVIAAVGAGGLGLPERDYYFKDDEKAKETRQKYLAHVATTLELAGMSKADAEKAAATVMKMETGFAGASLTNVELRDPYATDQKMTLHEVQKLTPGFDWTKYFDTLKADPQVAVNVDQPKFCRKYSGR
jgi:endothelin-converting enzyme/putative endopeptidase